MPLKSPFYGRRCKTNWHKEPKEYKNCRYIKNSFYLFSDYKSLQIQIKHQLLASAPVALRMLTCLDDVEMCMSAPSINLPSAAQLGSACYWIFCSYVIFYPYRALHSSHPTFTSGAWTIRSASQWWLYGTRCGICTFSVKNAASGSGELHVIPKQKLKWIPNLNSTGSYR